MQASPKNNEAQARTYGKRLVGVTVHDPMTFAAAGVLLTIVAVAACLAPARSATRIQPVDALRVD